MSKTSITQSEEEMLRDAALFVDEVRFLYKERHLLREEIARLRYELYETKRKLKEVCDGV